MTLLVIDDDVDDVTLFLEALGTLQEGHTFFSAVNGADGLRMAKVVKPDVIFLDINMPVMGGKETLVALRNDKYLAHIPVCMISTTSNTEEITWYLKGGANGFIIKPNTFYELCVRIRKFLTTHSSSHVE